MNETSATKIYTCCLLAASSHFCLAAEMKTCNFLLANAKLGVAQEALDAKAAQYKKDPNAFLRSADQKPQAADVFRRLLLGEHEVVKGDGIVVTLWRQSEDQNVTDSDRFWRLSIEIPTAIQEQTYRFGDSGTRAYYSEAPWLGFQWETAFTHASHSVTSPF